MLKNKKIRLFLVSVFVLLLISFPALYFYKKYQKATKLLNNQKAPTELELESLLKKVNQIIVLPEGEIPTVATVTDKNKVNNQPFFASSENGDKALIYTQAKKAFLYRPSTHKIINVAPVNIRDDSTATASPTILPTTK